MNITMTRKEEVVGTTLWSFEIILCKTTCEISASVILFVSRWKKSQMKVFMMKEATSPFLLREVSILLWKTLIDCITELIFPWNYKCNLALFAEAIGDSWCSEGRSWRHAKRDEEEGTEDNSLIFNLFSCLDHLWTDIVLNYQLFEVFFCHAAFTYLSVIVLPTVTILFVAYWWIHSLTEILSCILF